MNNLDFLNKEEVDTFVWSSAKLDRYNCKNTMYLGRYYTKWGDEQIVTFFGIKYAVKNLDTNKTEYVVIVGMSKQHPEDVHHDKKIAMETARINALIDPFMTIRNVSKEFTKQQFIDMVRAFHTSMDLDFIMTSEEANRKQAINEEKEWMIK